jgi:hypothetical protein
LPRPTEQRVSPNYEFFRLVMQAVDAMHPDDRPGGRWLGPSNGFCACRCRGNIIGERAARPTFGVLAAVELMGVRQYAPAQTKQKPLDQSVNFGKRISDAPLADPTGQAAAHAGY